MKRDPLNQARERFPFTRPMTVGGHGVNSPGASTASRIITAVSTGPLRLIPAYTGQGDQQAGEERVAHDCSE